MWLDELVEMKRVSGKTLKQISAEAAIPLGTLNKIFAGQTADPKFETLKAIVHCLGYPLDDLSPANKKSPALSSEAMRLANDFDALDEHGQRVVRVVTDEELSRMAAETQAPEPEAAPVKSIPLYQPFAAGVPEPDLGGRANQYVVPADSPAGFAIGINGTSMEPYLHDQSVALGVWRDPKNGEVGAFRLNGEFLVKQYFRDQLGTVYLLSLNRKEEDRDVVLWAQDESFTQLVVLGTILMDKKPPLPRI